LKQKLITDLEMKFKV